MISKYKGGKNTKKQLVIVGIIILFICTGLSGCNEKSSVGGDNKSPYTGEKKIEHVNATLDTLSLKVNDIAGDFEKTSEEYITKPFFDKNPSSPLNGEYIQEKYNATFIESDYSKIIETIFRFKSNVYANDNMDKIVSFIRTEFPELTMATIGDKSYLGETSITISGTNVPHYVLVFCRGDILVFLDGYGPVLDNFIGYGQIIDFHMRHAVSI